MAVKSKKWRAETRGPSTGYETMVIPHVPRYIIYHVILLLHVAVSIEVEISVELQREAHNDIVGGVMRWG